MFKKESSVFSTLQRIGQSFMFPIALLPIAGILLGIGASFSNPQVISSFGLEKILGENTFLYFLFMTMKNTGGIVFANLPLIFAMGIALGMAQKEKAVASLSAAISFLVMHETISSLLSFTGKLNSGVLQEGSIASVCGIQSLEMGVFGGMIVGLGVAYLHNKFYKIKLPDIISFFGGIRFIPIISCITYIFVGVLMFFAWPYVQTAMFSLGELVTASRYAGTLLYGLIKRALIPFGLHHVFYMPFWQTALGGTALVDGHYVTGAQNIFFAELASPNVSKFSIGVARFMAGEFPFMIFGLPAAAFAMYQTAKPSKKKIVGGLLLSAAFTSMLTGITEPIEFTFLFVAPALYGVHCVIAGTSYMIMHILKVTVGLTFSGGFIDFLLFGILQGNQKTNWIYVIPVGIIYALIYYFVFRFAILKFNLKTPGREDDDVETKLYTKKDFNKNTISQKIVQGLGNLENIQSVDCCATRLRVKVNNPDIVDTDILKSTGAAGVIKKDDGIQVVYGPKVSIIKSELEEYMQSVSKNS